MRPIIINLLVIQILLSASFAAADPGPPPEYGLFRDGYYAGKVFLYDTGYILTSPLRLTGRQALVWGGSWLSPPWCITTTRPSWIRCRIRAIHQVSSGFMKWGNFLNRWGTWA